MYIKRKYNANTKMFSFLKTPKVPKDHKIQERPRYINSKVFDTGLRKLIDNIHELNSSDFINNHRNPLAQLYNKRLRFTCWKNGNALQDIVFSRSVKSSYISSNFWKPLWYMYFVKPVMIKLSLISFKVLYLFLPSNLCSMFYVFLYKSIRLL